MPFLQRRVSIGRWVSLSWELLLTIDGTASLFMLSLAQPEQYYQVRVSRRANLKLDLYPFRSF